ncbi:MAG: hypothetical protein KC620_04210 [Myxococcales bacterium]|nr:hypothetical protein [Myxococcales bacterium]
MHPRAGVSAAYDSNFFRDAVGEAAEPPDPVSVLRFDAGLRLETRNPSRLGVDLALEAAWRQVSALDDASPEKAIEARNGFDRAQLGVGFSLLPRSSVTVELKGQGQYTDEPAYERVVDAGYQRLEAEFGPDFRFRPGERPESRAFEMRLGYRFNLLRYLDAVPQLGTNRAQRDTHKFQLLTRWNFFPKTAALLDAQFWIINYPQVNDLRDAQTAGASPDLDSTPLRIEAGLQGLLTPRLSLTARAGFAHTFNAAGKSYQGFIGRVEAEYRLAPTLKLRLGYARAVGADGFSNYYTLDRVFLDGTVNLPARLHLTLRGGFDRYVYSTVGATEWAPERIEPILLGAAELGWAATEWLSLAASWQVENNRSDFCYRLDLVPGGCATVADPSLVERSEYVRHVVMLKLATEY